MADLFAVKELLGHKDVKSGAEGQKFGSCSSSGVRNLNTGYHSAIEEEGFKSLQEGESDSFEVEPRTRGPHTIRIPTVREMPAKRGEKVVKRGRAGTLMKLCVSVVERAAKGVKFPER